MNGRVLHISKLSTADACKSQIVWFYETFGEAVEVTPEKAREFSGVFNIGFAAVTLLTDSTWDKFRAERGRLRAKLNADHEPLWAKYEPNQHALYAKLEAERAPLLADYKSNLAALWAEFYVSEGVTA